MIAGRRFQFRPVLTVFVLASLAILVSLGTWQLKRLQWKEALIASVDARVHSEPIPFGEALARAEAGENMEYQPVTLEGAFLPEGDAKVFGSYDGAPGAYVFMPVDAGLSKLVYVNEGFAPQGMADAEDTAPRTIVGLFRSTERPSPPASWVLPQGRSDDGLWFIRSPQEFAAAVDRDAFAFYIDEGPVAGREWPKGGTTRLEFSNRHLEYALTWYGLAAALIGVWIVFSLKEGD